MFLIVDNDLHSFSKESWHSDMVINILDVYKRLNPTVSWQQAVFVIEELYDVLYSYVLSLKDDAVWHQLFRVTEGVAEYHRAVPRYWDHMIKSNSTTLMLPNPSVISKSY